MEVTAKEAATLLGLSPRAVRQQIESGKLKAIKRAGQWYIDRSVLPMDEKQVERTRRFKAKLMDVVERTLEKAPPKAASPKKPSLPGQASKDQAAPPRAAATQAYSLAHFRVYGLAFEMYRALERHPKLVVQEAPLRPAPLGAFLEGLRALSVGYYHFDRSLKRDAWLRARHCFARAVNDLLLLSEPDSLAALGLAADQRRASRHVDAPEAPASDAAPAAPPVVSVQVPEVLAPEQALLLLEAELLPALGRLLRQGERRR